MPRRDDHVDTHTKSTNAFQTACWRNRSVPCDEDDPNARCMVWRRWSRIAPGALS